jgi:GGDEF domain-containing protein
VCYPDDKVAIYPEHGESESELIHHADSAMYLAKKEQAN